MYYTKDELIVLPITLLIIIAISLLLYILLRKKSDKIKNIPLALIAITILVLEVIKQHDYISSGVWSFWQFPLHFCSLFLFFFPVATLIPNKKIKEFGSTMSFVCCTWMTILFYINPTSIIGNSSGHVFSDFYTFHTFTYHHLVILYLLVSILLNQVKISNKYYIYVIFGLSIYGAIAIPTAHLTGTNYCNILTSNIPFMESLRVNMGQVIYTIALYLAGILGGVFTCFVYKKLKIKGGEK